MFFKPSQLLKKQQLLLNYLNKSNQQKQFLLSNNSLNNKILFNFSRKVSQQPINNKFQQKKEIQNRIQNKTQERIVFDSKLNKSLTQQQFEEHRKQQLLSKQQQNTQNNNPQIQINPDNNSIQVPKLVINQDRLSKYLSNTGICSRRQAEQMISQGLVFVDGKKVKSNMLVSVKNDIKIFTTKGEKVPLPQDTKIYVFYKPRGLLCTHDDPLNRPTVFQWLKNETKLDMDHLISVGRLDFNSEGLLLLTNNGELASCLESPYSNIMREYRVRVHGKLDEIKLLKIRGGAVIKDVQYGPFECEIDNRQTSNTWLKIRMYQGKNREIRKVMQKYDLSVNRLKRLTYGCYKIGKMVPGDIFESYVQREIKRKLYLHVRKKFEHYNSDIREKLIEKYGDDIEYIEEKDLTDQEKLYLANHQYDPNNRIYYKQEKLKQGQLQNQNKNNHSKLLLTEPRIIF